jgi:hypothetical protein
MALKVVKIMHGRKERAVRCPFTLVLFLQLTGPQSQASSAGEIPLPEIFTDEVANEIIGVCFLLPAKFVG